MNVHFRFRFVFDRKWNFIFVGIFVDGRKWKNAFRSASSIHHKKVLVLVLKKSLDYITESGTNSGIIIIIIITRFVSHVKSFTKWRIASAGWSQVSVGKPGCKVQFLNATWTFQGWWSDLRCPSWTNVRRVIQQQFWKKESDILGRGSKYSLTPPYTF